MNPSSLKTMSLSELLQMHAAIIDEMRSRDVLRSKNNPTGDYCEWLVANRLGLTLATKSTSGHDAVDPKGVRYQIKGRRVTKDNKSRQLGAIRNLDAQDFEYLVGIILDERFQVVRAVQIPHAVICEYATYRKHTNAYVMHLRGKLLSDPRVSDITAALATSST